MSYIDELFEKHWNEVPDKEFVFGCLDYGECKYIFENALTEALEKQREMIVEKLTEKLGKMDSASEDYVSYVKLSILILNTKLEDL